MTSPVRKIAAWVTVSREVIEDAISWDEAMRQARREYEAMSPEERERRAAERDAAYEAERCSECGRHPDD